MNGGGRTVPCHAVCVKLVSQRVNNASLKTSTLCIQNDSLLMKRRRKKNHQIICKWRPRDRRQQQQQQRWRWLRTMEPCWKKTLFFNYCILAPRDISRPSIEASIRPTAIKSFKSFDRFCNLISIDCCDFFHTSPRSRNVEKTKATWAFDYDDDDDDLDANWMGGLNNRLWDWCSWARNWLSCAPTTFVPWGGTPLIIILYNKG